MDLNKTKVDAEEQELKKIGKLCNSNFYVGEDDWVESFCKDKILEKCRDCNRRKEKLDDFKKLMDRIRIHLKNYLQLDNVSLLFGSGSSLHLGSVSIRYIPEQIIEEINKEDASRKLYAKLAIMYNKANNNEMAQTDTEQNLKNIPLESFINYLLGLEYILSETPNLINDDKNELINAANVMNLISVIKRKLFELCDLDEIDIDGMDFYKCNENGGVKEKMVQYGRYIYHVKLLKSLLQRPLNLRRINVFTTNYDLAFERAFDELGIYYIDGFSGFQKRVFRPEVYEHDIYFPGTTTEGKVRRVEKVIRYFKLHGSISWIKSKPEAFNQYGLEEKPVELIRNYMKMNRKSDEKIGELIIYPSSCKKGYTLDFPYSELFRQFATTITQPQSVLFCIGYSFNDEHINDIIFQALSIPSFTLIIVDYNGIKNEVILKLKRLGDPRIIILQGEYLGDFKIFAEEIIPNFHELDIREKVSKTLGKLYHTDNKNPECEEEDDV